MNEGAVGGPRADGPAIPLNMLGPGESGVVAEIRGLRHHHHEGPGVKHAGPDKQYRRGHIHHSDRGHRLEHRLQHMGLVQGARLTVVQNRVSGPVIVAVKDTRLALAKGAASRVMVVAEPGGPRQEPDTRPAPE